MAQKETYLHFVWSRGYIIILAAILAIEIAIIRYYDNSLIWWILAIFFGLILIGPVIYGCFIKDWNDYKKLP